MKNIKEIWRDHKLGIVAGIGIATSVVIGIIAVAIISKQEYNNETKRLTEGKNVISWTPNNKFMNLERVKEILDLNADNASQFAIFREGPDPNAYACILLSDDVVTEMLV
jgi:hypothetical protein